MKYSLLILMSLFISFSLSAKPAKPAASPKRVNDLFRWIAHQEGLRDYALYSIIANRCNRYMPFGDAGACKYVVSREIKLLDYDMVFADEKHGPMPKDTWNPNAFVFIAFKQNLVNILSEQRTQAYLQDLNLRLSKFLTGEDENLNVWELTLAHYQTPLEAAKAMAALFQDTSIVKLHLAYLERTRTRGRLYFDANKELLSRVIETINLVLDYSEDNYRRLFYPRNLQDNLNRNIYHFYVPLYLAMALQAEGYNKRFSLIGPVMLTLAYEFVTAASDYRYLFDDPVSLDPRVYAGKLKDIYGGFLGPWFGLGKKASPSFFTIMSSDFARSTGDGVRLLTGLL